MPTGMEVSRPLRIEPGAQGGLIPMTPIKAGGHRWHVTGFMRDVLAALAQDPKDAEIAHLRAELGQRDQTTPECEVIDQIVPWADVQPGDLILWDGEFCPVERIYPMDSGNPAVVIAGDQHNGTIPVGTYAAVRRYVETPAGQEG